jgi:tetratricopeptide (TPR) repeat protein
MAAAFADAGDQQAALDCYAKALVLASELGERHAQAESHQGIGAAHLALGQSRSAVDDYRLALKLSREIADPVQAGRALYGLGCALLETEGAAAAGDHWREALALFEATGRPEADEVRARLSATQESLGGTDR